jgi:F-type H+-transporting ATPase subunit epsilon
MANLHLHLLTPDNNFFDGDVEEVIFSTSEGRIGIMAGHSPTFASVVEGVIELLIDGEWKITAVSQGFARVHYDMTEIFLDSVEWADNIDVVRAEQALKRAEQRSKTEISRVEHIRTQAAMSRALARLKAANLHSNMDK